jgi:cytochrome c5
MRSVGFALAALVAACGEGTPAGPDPVSQSDASMPLSYARDVQPIFAAKCVRCHFTGVPGIRVDLENPFDPEHGVVNRPNTWPDAPTRVLVVPKKPAESFLIEKITRSDLDPAIEGVAMPRQTAPLTADELAAVSSWISAGANDDAQYRDVVAYIFYNKCHDCHNAASPVAPNTDDPFGPDGLVGVEANVKDGASMQRVEREHPERSVLYHKVAGDTPAALGAPMPFQVPTLTPQEIDVITRWVAEGALDN